MIDHVGKIIHTKDELKACHPNTVLMALVDPYVRTFLAQDAIRDCVPWGLPAAVVAPPEATTAAYRRLFDEMRDEE